jgi:GTP-binding protein EngB required for normal cell division
MLQVDDNLLSNWDTLDAVPVVAVFTKMDALDSKAWNELVGQNMSREEAKQRAPEQSLSIVKSQYMSELLTMRYPPKGGVYMRGMFTTLAVHSNILTGST